MLKSFRSALPKIIPVIILIVLAFTYRDVLRSMVLVPLAYLIFVIRLITEGIGEQILWISFVVFSSIIAIISLAMRREVQLKDEQIGQKYNTRLQDWLQVVERKEHSKYFQWNLAQDLSKLVIEAIAYRQGISRKQVVRQLETGELDIPSNILAYLQISQKPFMHTGLADYGNGNWFLQIWSSLIRKPLSNKKGDQSPLDLNPEIIIHFLEDYLDITPEIQAG